MLRICPQCDKTFDSSDRRMFPCPEHPPVGEIATLQPMDIKDAAVLFVSAWTPKPGWLMLTPVVLPEKTEGGIVLPESVTVKSTSGIVVKIGGTTDELYDLMGKEVFFAQHDAYKINDTDTGVLLYILHNNKVIMWREPQERLKFFPISREKEGVSFPPSLSRSLGSEPEV